MVVLNFKLTLFKFELAINLSFTQRINDQMLVANV